MLPIKLYSMAYQDRSDRVRWLLEEMNIPYENHFLKKSSGDMQNPSYLELNPMGRVPTIVDGDITLFESAAICLYLADTYSYGSLAPKMENKIRRAHYLKWMVYSVGSLEAVIAHMFTHMNSPEEIERTKKYVADQCEVFKKALIPVLEKNTFILGEEFSAADIMIGTIIPGAHDYLIKDIPVMESYMERLMTRPAAIKAKVF